jgi:hypothetical protein
MNRPEVGLRVASIIPWMAGGAILCVYLLSFLYTTFELDLLPPTGERTLEAARLQGEKEADMIFAVGLWLGGGAGFLAGRSWQRRARRK